MNILALFWLLTSFDGNYWSRVECPETIQLQPKPHYAVMVTQPCGNIAWSYLQVTLTINGTDPQFSYRGEGLWNLCPGTNQVRLYFTDTTNVYHNVSSALNPNHYWWSTAYIYIDPARWSLGYPATIAANVFPWDWTNGIGHSGTENWAAFVECAQNATEFGVCLGNNCVFDSGIDLNSGEATISVQ